MSSLVYAPSQPHVLHVPALFLPGLMLTLGPFCYGFDQGRLLCPGDTIIRPVFVTTAEMGL